MLRSNRAKAALNMVLAALFAVVGLGAAFDERPHAWPLALIFGAFAGYSLIKGIGFLRKQHE